MEPECFRIKLNLSEFFRDQRKLSYILIDLNKLNDFYDLERRIRRIFAIKETFIFLIDDIFVPHSESIKLIHEEEMLTVVPDTIGLDTYVVKPDFGRKVGTKISLIKAARKKKKKRLLCQDGCQEYYNYIPTKCCNVISPKKMRIIETLNQCNTQDTSYPIETLNQCNTQDTSYPCVESDTIMPDCETVEIHGSENEMFLRVNKVYNFGKEKHVDDSDSPRRKKKKVQFKNIKKVEKDNEKPNVLEEKTIGNETENNSIKDESGKYDHSENCENVNISEISLPSESCNPRLNNLLINEVPISKSTINVSKPTKIRTRKQKQAVSKLPNIAGLQMLESSKTHTMLTEDEINSTKEKFSEIQADKFLNQNVVSEVDITVLHKTRNSTPISEFYNTLPLKSEAFLARMKSPNPADTFHKHMSPPLVMCNSKTSQEYMSNDEEQPIIIDDDDDFINLKNLEKYHLINSAPRKGDILAFKLNNVVSTCASNITDYIVGRVIKYCEDTSQITVIVLRGQDQLQEHQGRFSIFEDVEKSCNKNKTYEFNWNELLETRLLFP